MRGLIRIGVIGMCSALAAPALGEADKELGACAAKKSDVERLACYDELAEARGVAKTTERKAGPGKWEVTIDTNPMDDSRTVILTLEADEGKNAYGQKPVFFLRCKSERLVAYVNWGTYLGGGARVTHRIGKRKPQTDDWSLSTDKKASFYPGSKRLLIKALAEHDSLVVEITPYNENPITAVFDTTGLGDHLDELKQECPW